MSRRTPGRRRPEGRGPSIRPSAWFAWEHFDVPLAGGPHLLTEVLDVLMALPAEEVETRTIPMDPRGLKVLEGTVHGVRMRILGRADAWGRWLEVWDIHPIGLDE